METKNNFITAGMGMEVNNDYVVLPWNVDINDHNYSSADLEAMTIEQLEDLKVQIRQIDGPGIIGENIWIENYITTMLLQHRVQKLERKLEEKFSLSVNKE